MNTQIAIRTLDALASGMDPVTGEIFPEASPYNQPVVLRSLFIALKALQQPAAAQSATHQQQSVTSEQVAVMAREEAVAVEAAGADAARAEASETTPARKGKQPKVPRVPPANAGKAWTPEEDQQLCHEFDSGIAVKELAVKHSRSAAALNARLFKLGKIADPGFPLRIRPTA